MSNPENLSPVPANSILKTVPCYKCSDFVSFEKAEVHAEPYAFVHPQRPVTTMISPASAIGYIRVSTAKQNEDDYALEAQAEKIRRLCAERGIRLIAIYEDTKSAVDPYSLERRPSLDEAVRWAERENACLMVPEPTRLFLNTEVAKRWRSSVTVPVYSVRHARILTEVELLEAVRDGEDIARATSEGTIRALDVKRKSGATLGSKGDRAAANKASALARGRRSDRITDTIARILLEDEAYLALSHQALADLLNRRKVLSGWGRPWTRDGIKRHRKDAGERIREWTELDQELLPALQIVDGEAQEVISASDAAVASTPEDDEAIMRKLPTFGVF